MREDFQGGKDGFRLKILLDSSNRASENQKNSYDTSNHPLYHTNIILHKITTIL